MNEPTENTETTQNTISPQALQTVRDEMPDEDTLFDLAELFKIFGDSTRIKILFALLGRELSVGDIAEVLSMTQSAISHQLRVLKANGLVRFRREGKSLIYALSDDHVTKILNMGLEHIEE
ncbi:MAG: helix-turn-helix transcriptional regulator [Treponema sp.]|nr:helix-turn-helix transcriptional regulator [Treponema sp.]